MAAKEKAKVMAQTEEERYEYAIRIEKSTACLLRNKEKADIFGDLVHLYNDLGEFQDAAERSNYCKEQEEKYKKLAEKDEEAKKAKEYEKKLEEKNQSKGIAKKIILALVVIIVVAGIGGIIYLKSKPGRYARASFYERIENYEKSYKMFNNLKDYRDSVERYYKSKYEYGIQCKQNDDYEDAKNALRSLADYKDSASQLTELEIDNIEKSNIGDSILYGEYKWLVVEKKENKVLLVKSEPINGYSYNNKDESVTWETCSLRKYLNGVFFDNTFCETMQEHILDTDINVSDNVKYGTKGGKNTTDKLFLLNDEQAEEYREILSNYNRDWWIINPGNSQNTAQYVSYGEIMDYGYNVTSSVIHIRPAMWISLE